MRRLMALPRISREGWIHAGPEKRVNKRAMLIPKTGDSTEHIPRLFDFSEVICPAERRALREIVETAEVVRQNGHVYLTARVSAATLDSLASFETSREDLEDGGDHEQEDPESDLGSSQPFGLEDCELDEADDEPDDDREYDFPRERQKYIKDRQEPERVHEWNGRRFVDPPSYDATKDRDELRKVQRQVSALAAKKRKRAKA